MASLGVKLPISKDDTDGFTMIKDLRTLIKQNLKMIILTSPGERVMEPDFGVGLREYLFSNFGEDTFEIIDSNIRKQVSIFLPSIELNDIVFDDSAQLMDSNTLSITLTYSMPNIGIKDLLELTI
tara:strand:- start:3746 stop:4120 length:375 start_codon:yes stop_codon:yes gene_type:complete